MLWDQAGTVSEMTQGDFLDTHPRWDPSGSRLAFLSNRKKPQPGIFLFSGIGDPKNLVDLQDGAIGAFKWSPDGNRIAFTYQSTPAEWTEETIKTRKENKNSDPPRIIEQWPYRMDGEGYWSNESMDLYVLECSSGVVEKVFVNPDHSDIDFAWARDSDRIAITCRMSVQKYLEPPGNELFILELKNRKIRKFELPRGEKTAHSWSPLGDKLAFIFDVREEDPWWPKRQEIGCLEVASGVFSRYLATSDLFIESHVIGDSRDPAPTVLFWGPKENELMFALGRHGSQDVVRYRFEDKEVTPVTTDLRGEFHLGSISDDGQVIAGVITTPTFPCEAARYDCTSNSMTTTCMNEWVQEEILLAEPEEISVTSADSTPIQSWRLRHPRTEPGPAVIEVHGGPMAMYTTAFFFEMQLLAAQGFTVFFSNPRGSTGYGEEFCRSIKGNWGGKDWEDVQALTDSAAADPLVDSSRLAIMGGSYGGYLVNWAVSHTQRFKRAITDRCVSNLLSKWGNSDYLFVPDAQWPGSAFGDMEQLWECSPIKHFANVRTPVLILHSEGDLRCNIEQGEQIYAALKILNVETRFVRYPSNTTHGMSRSGPPDLRVHRLKEILAWLASV